MSGELTHFEEHLCIPLFSFSVPYSAQLAFQITNAIKMAPNHDRTLSLAKSQLPLGCIYCIGRNGFKTSAAPSKEHGAFPAPWPPVNVTSSACSAFICSGSVFHNHSTATVTPSLVLSSIILHIDNVVISNHTTVCREDTRCEAEL